MGHFGDLLRTARFFRQGHGAPRIRIDSNFVSRQAASDASTTASAENNYENKHPGSHRIP
jgi:hypothetical protein